MNNKKAEWYTRTNAEDIAVWNNTGDAKHDERNLCIIIARNLGFGSAESDIRTLQNSLEPMFGFYDRMPEANDSAVGVILTSATSGNCYGLKADRMKGLRDALTPPPQ